jgi:hypothetical protein
MKLIITLIFFSVLSLFAEIDECKSDIYFANGIREERSKKEVLADWKNIVDEMSLGNAKVAYNKSEGFVNDLLEAFYQKVKEEKEYQIGYTNYKKFFVDWQNQKIQDEWSEMEDYFDETENETLKKNFVANFKQNIKDGHAVIVIAHSQGNLFTNRAYKELDEWMRAYFHMMGVATPADHVAGGGPYVTFDNDPIHLVPNSLPDNIENPDQSKNNTLGYNFFYHSFSYYMSTPITKNKIEAFIKNKVKEHKNAPSQWITDQEIKPNSCEYKITLKHRFDSSLNEQMIGVEVYPFKPNKKLYLVESKVDNKDRYVKASCGGKLITDNWEGKKANNCFLLTKVKEKINREINITVTGKVTTAECKMTAKSKNQELNFWAEGCKYKTIKALHDYVYSRADTFRQLPNCDKPQKSYLDSLGLELGETLDSEIPDGYVLVDENITKTTTLTYPAYNGLHVAYTNVQKPTNGNDSIFCYSMVSSFAWSVDEYSGILETKYFKRIYQLKDK